MRTLAVSIRLTGIPLAAALVPPLVAHAQNRTALRQRYGDAIGEVYRTSNGLTIAAYFDAHGTFVGSTSSLRSEGGG